VHVTAKAFGQLLERPNLGAKRWSGVGAEYECHRPLG
jgi:hypothetical protein